MSVDLVDDRFDEVGSERIQMMREGLERAWERATAAKQRPCACAQTGKAGKEGVQGFPDLQSRSSLFVIHSVQQLPDRESPRRCRSRRFRNIVREVRREKSDAEHRGVSGRRSSRDDSC